MPRSIRKAVFPVAGLGTRFLPATKAVPKELLPVLDRPLIDYALAEAREAGIERFIFVAGRNRESLAAHFGTAPALEAALEAKDPALLKALKDDEPDPGAVAFATQDAPLGLGHAVWCARELVGEEPFAVILPDDLMQARSSTIGDLVAVHEETGGNVVAVEEVPRAHTNRYGVLEVGADDGARVEVRGLVEKPAPEDAPSTLIVIGRYVLRPEVFGHLARGERGAGGEIQLTDAMARMIGTAPFHGLRIKGRRYDCGSKAGFLEAQIGFALARDDLRDGLVRFLRSQGREWE